MPKRSLKWTGAVRYDPELFTIPSLRRRARLYLHCSFCGARPGNPCTSTVTGFGYLGKSGYVHEARMLPFVQTYHEGRRRGARNPSDTGLITAGRPIKAVG